MYRYIDIDLTRGADDVCSSYTIGRDGENRATAFRLKLPDKFVSSSVIIEFKLADGSSYSSRVLPYSEEIVYPLEEFLMIEGLMTAAVVITDVTSGTVVKPFQKRFVVSNAINVVPDSGLPYSVASDHEKRISILENNQNQADFAENNSTAPSYIKNRSHFDTAGFTLKWDGVIGDREFISESGDDDEYVSGFVKISDVPPNECAMSKINSDDIRITMQDGSVYSFTDLMEEYCDNIVESIAPDVYAADEMAVFVLSDEYDVSDGEGVILTRGIWLFWCEEGFVSDMKIPDGAKAIDLKYIPKKAFGSIEVVSDTSSEVAIGVFDKDGKETERVRIPKGKTPVKGVDYMTTADINNIVAKTIQQLSKWNGGSY